jgi:hypothetical protein
MQKIGLGYCPNDFGRLESTTQETWSLEMLYDVQYSVLIDISAAIVLGRIPGRKDS